MPTPSFAAAVETALVPGGLLFEAEDAHIASGELTSDFAVVVARKR